MNWAIISISIKIIPQRHDHTTIKLRQICIWRPPLQISLSFVKLNINISSHLLGHSPVKSEESFGKGPQYSAQYILQAAHNCVQLQFQRHLAPVLLLYQNTCIQIPIHVHTHKYKYVYLVYTIYILKLKKKKQLTICPAQVFKLKEVYQFHAQLKTFNIETAVILAFA